MGDSDKSWEIYKFAQEDPESFIVWLDFSGSKQCITGFQVEIQADSGTKVASPFFRLFADPRKCSEVLIVSDILG
jgi:hypothetical protein